MSELFTAAQVKNLFPRRRNDVNKGDFGYVTLIGGCVKYSGAVRLASMANSAMRCGAGVCTIAAPQSLTGVILSQILESTFYPLSDFEGNLKFCAREFDELMIRADVIAFGMGIGNTDETYEALKYILHKYDGILIVDADGINAMAKMDKKDIVENRKCKLVLTPHPKEFARLAGMDTDEVLRNPEANAGKLAAKLKAIVLLKGHVSYVSNGALSYRIEKGCAGMATAGSGDVLAGVLAAVMGIRPNNLLAATAAAAYINGLAGEIAQAKHGEASMLAGDTATCIEDAIQIIEQGADLDWSVSDSYQSGITTEMPNLNLPESWRSVAQDSEAAKLKAKKKELKRQKALLKAEQRELRQRKIEEKEAAYAARPKNQIGNTIFNIIFAFILICAMCLTVYFVDYSMTKDMLAAEEALVPKDTRLYQADRSQRMEFLQKDIYIDGILVNNYQTESPLVTYSDNVYIPLNELYCDALGIEASYSIEDLKEIRLEAAEAKHKGIYEENVLWNLMDMDAVAKGNVTIYIDGELEGDPMSLGRTYPALWGKTVTVPATDPVETIFPQASEVVCYKSTVYIPLYMLTNSEILGISAYEDEVSGVYISTDPDIPAEKYYSKNNADYINGRAEYIKYNQPGLDIETCREYEYYFRHEANVYNISEDLIMALAKAESNFNKDDLSSAGARGMMQTMPGTARSQGYDPDTLYDPHVSIEFGTLYLYYALGNFNGDPVRAISVYLYGGRAVLSGNYSTSYANSVLNRQKTMETWITNNGYSNEFYTVLECTK